MLKKPVNFRWNTDMLDAARMAARDNHMSLTAFIAWVLSAWLREKGYLA